MYEQKKKAKVNIKRRDEHAVSLKKNTGKFGNVFENKRESVFNQRNLQRKILKKNNNPYKYLKNYNAKVKQKKTYEIPGDEVIQRKFGFEVELGLAIGWSKRNNNNQRYERYTAPDEHITMPTAAKGRGFDVHIDHSRDIRVVKGSNSIIELVTVPPIDESTTSENDVRSRMREMTDFVSNARSETKNLERRAKLRNIKGIKKVNTKNGYLFVGGNEKGEQQLDNGYMQATYAIKLEKMPKMFAHISKAENNIDACARIVANKVIEISSNYDEFIEEAGLMDKAWIKVKDGKTIEESIYESVWDKNVRVKYDERLPKLKTAMAPLIGYFSLIINYLLLGKVVAKRPDNNLGKNHLGLIYYKSRLSSIRNSLPIQCSWILNDQDLVDYASNWLADVSHRDYMEEVQEKAFPNRNKMTSKTLVMNWLENILTGKSDDLFDQTKNEYSDEIAPYNVGQIGEQSIGGVVEERRVAPRGGFKYEETNEKERKYRKLKEGMKESDRHISEWGDIAIRLWNYLRDINDVDHN